MAHPVPGARRLPIYCLIPQSTLRMGLVVAGSDVREGDSGSIVRLLLFLQRRGGFGPYLAILAPRRWLPFSICLPSAQKNHVAQSLLNAAALGRPTRPWRRGGAGARHGRVHYGIDAQTLQSLPYIPDRKHVTALRAKDE
jgi:hypothetical protein